MPEPRIGVATQGHGGLVPWLFLWLNVKLAGGVPLRITPARPRHGETFDGLILSGGADIVPRQYGGVDPRSLARAARDVGKRRSWWIRLPRALVAGIIYLLRYVAARKDRPDSSPERDALEIRLLHKVFAEGLPVLGICRGMQLINVVRGGTLHQEIAAVFENAIKPSTIFPVRKVAIDGSSRLAGIMGRTSALVNAMHHQAVREPGKGLAVIARDGSGMIQALEGVDDTFVLGVQWHPEYMIQFRSQRRIFQALVRAARNV